MNSREYNRKIVGTPKHGESDGEFEMEAEGLTVIIEICWFWIEEDDFRNLNTNN